MQIFSKKKKFIRRQDVPDTFEITTIAYVVNSKFSSSSIAKKIFLTENIYRNQKYY